METGNLFGTIEARYGLPMGYLSRTYQIESGGNPNAQNPNSSAGGGFQFIDSTARAYGLTDKTDLAASADAAARLARDNAAQLRRVLGRDPTSAELYLAHQQGGGGASALLANPDRLAVDIVGPDAVRLNGGNPNMTAGEFANLWLRKFGGAAGKPASDMEADGAGRIDRNPARLAWAYANGKMTPEDAAIYERGMAEGVFPKADKPTQPDPLQVYAQTAMRPRAAFQMTQLPTMEARNAFGRL